VGEGARENEYERLAPSSMRDLPSPLQESQDGGGGVEGGCPDSRKSEGMGREPKGE